MTNTGSKKTAFYTGYTFDSNYQESVFEHFFYETQFFKYFAKGIFEQNGRFIRTSHSKEPDRIVTHIMFSNKPNAQIFGDLLKKEIGIIPKIYQVDNQFCIHYGSKESIALYDYFEYYDDIHSEPYKIMFEWLVYKGIQNTYYALCNKCNQRYIRMHPGDKICKKCRKHS